MTVAPLPHAPKSTNRYEENHDIAVAACRRHAGVGAKEIRPGKVQGRPFPLYDEMKDKQRELHRASHAFFRQNANSDAACRSLIVQRDKAELQMKVIEKKYHEKFLQVLPPMKVYKILYAEAKFHRQAFKKAAQKDD